MTTFTESFLESECRGAISLVPVFFTINNGQVATQSDTHIADILHRVLGQLANIGAHLRILSKPTAQDEVVASIYDVDTLPLVTGEYLHVDDNLDEQEKARLLVQGISGSVAIAARLSKFGVPVTENLLFHEVHQFASSGQPARVRETVEKSHLFNDCLMMDQILDLIMYASHGGESPTASSSKTANFSDYNSDVFGSEYQRPSRNMGQPFGFSIMPLN